MEITSLCLLALKLSWLGFVLVIFNLVLSTVCDCHSLGSHFLAKKDQVLRIPDFQDFGLHPAFFPVGGK